MPAISGTTFPASSVRPSLPGLRDDRRSVEARERRDEIFVEKHLGVESYQTRLFRLDVINPSYNARFGPSAAKRPAAASEWARKVPNAYADHRLQFLCAGFIGSVRPP